MKGIWRGEKQRLLSGDEWCCQHACFNNGLWSNSLTSGRVENDNPLYKFHATSLYLYMLYGSFIFFSAQIVCKTWFAGGLDARTTYFSKAKDREP